MITDGLCYYFIIILFQKQVVIMTPRKDSVTSEDGERKDAAVVDKLSLLATSAGLLASPVQRNGQLQYSLGLSPLRSFAPPHIQSSLDDPPLSSSMSYRRARSQSMSAIDPPYNGFGGGNNSNAANMLKSNPNGTSTILFKKREKKFCVFIFLITNVFRSKCSSYYASFASVAYTPFVAKHHRGWSSRRRIHWNLFP